MESCCWSAKEIGQSITASSSDDSLSHTHSLTLRDGLQSSQEEIDHLEQTLYNERQLSTGYLSQIQALHHRSTSWRTLLLSEMPLQHLSHSQDQQSFDRAQLYEPASLWSAGRDLNEVPRRFLKIFETVKATLCGILTGDPDSAETMPTLSLLRIAK